MKKTSETIFVDKEADKIATLGWVMLATITASSVGQSRYVTKFMKAFMGPIYPDLSLIMMVAFIPIYIAFVVLFIRAAIRRDASAQLIHCNLDDKKISTGQDRKNHRFSQKNISFNEIKKLTCNYIDKFWGQAVAFNLQTSDGEGLSLQEPFWSNKGEYNRIKFISLIKEQEDFEVELNNFPPRFLEKLAEFQNGGKLSFWDKYADRIRKFSIIAFFIAIYILCATLPR